MYDCSLNDSSELKDLIVENPDLPLLIFCGEDSWHDEWAYEQAKVNSCRVEELTMIDNQWVQRDDYAEELAIKLSCDSDFSDLSNNELAVLIEKRVAETDFVKAIVIYVG